MTIIAVLAALLLPALKNAKEKGKQAVCMNNLRQIHLGFSMYATDWDDFIPPVANCNAGKGPWFSYLGRAGYLGSAEPWPTWTFVPRWKTMRGLGSSYALNWYVSHYNYAYGFRKGFFAGPDDGNRANSPFVTDCRDMGEGWCLSYFLDYPPVRLELRHRVRWRLPHLPSLRAHR